MPYIHICLQHLQDKAEICLRYTKYMTNIPEICLRYAWGILEIFLRYAKEMVKMCVNMPKIDRISKYALYTYICLQDSQDKDEICLRYTKYLTNIPEICLKYAWGILEICLRYTWDIPEMYLIYTCDILEQNPRYTWYIPWDLLIMCLFPRELFWESCCLSLSLMVLPWDPRWGNIR